MQWPFSLLADHAAQRSRRRDLVELAAGYGLILAVCWTPNPPQRLLYWMAFAWIAGASLAAREDWRQMGFGPRGSLRSLWVLALALALSGLSLWIAAGLHTLHRLYGRDPVWAHAWGYFLWALMQQFILQDFVLLRLLRLARSKRRAVMAAVVLFAAAHLPNPLLVVLTLAWGAAACALFLRYRGLFTLGLVHALLGLSVAVTVPGRVHHHMRVGLGYLTYSGQRSGQPKTGSQSQRRKSDQRVSTEAWVMAEAATRRSDRQARP